MASGPGLTIAENPCGHWLGQPLANPDARSLVQCSPSRQPPKFNGNGLPQGLRHCGREHPQAAGDKRHPLMDYSDLGHQPLTLRGLLQALKMGLLAQQQPRGWQGHSLQSFIPHQGQYGGRDRRRWRHCSQRAQQLLCGEARLPCPPWGPEARLPLASVGSRECCSNLLGRDARGQAADLPPSLQRQAIRRRRRTPLPLLGGIITEL